MLEIFLTLVTFRGSFTYNYDITTFSRLRDGVVFFIVSDNWFGGHETGSFKNICIRPYAKSYSELTAPPTANHPFLIWMQFLRFISFASLESQL